MGGQRGCSAPCPLRFRSATKVARARLSAGGRAGEQGLSAAELARLGLVEAFKAAREFWRAGADAGGFQVHVPRARAPRGGPAAECKTDAARSMAGVAVASGSGS